MEPVKVDCALIFAIEEEFKITKGNRKLLVEADNYYSFEFYDKDGKKRKCITTYVSEPGSLEAYKFMIRFYEKYDPYVQFVIGISGQLDDDLKIGDVCIASSVEKYDYNSKLKGGEFKLSGKVVNLIYNHEFFKRLTNNEVKLYDRWQDNAKQFLIDNFTEDQIEELTKKKFINASKTNNYKYGKIATGESVIDDPKVKATIQDKDRKLLCVDMESFGFAEAAIDKNKNLVIVRGISDTSDGRKKELDNFGNSPELIRKWTLQNSYSLFQEITSNIISFPNVSDNDSFGGFISGTNFILDEIIKAKKYPVYDNYSRLFQNILVSNDTKYDGGNLFENFLKSLRQLEKKSSVFVQGIPGTGKSTFLYLTYKYLLFNGDTCSYLNIHDYKDSTLDDRNEKFDMDLKLLLNDKNVKYLIIDGVDQFERFFINKNVKLSSSTFLELQENYDNIILGITLQDYENEEDEDRQYYLPEPKIKIELLNFDFEVNNIETLINDLLFVNDIAISKVKSIKDFVKNTNLKELDWFATNILIKKIGHFNYQKEESVGGFFFNYLREFFSIAKNENAIKRTSELTFKKFIKEEHLTEDDYKSTLWNIIQRSNTLKHFLISEHLVEKYSNLDKNFEESMADLKHIYSYKINSYFKDSIGRRRRDQRKIFESVTTRYNQLDLIQKPNICYILGRLDELNFQSKKFLNEQLILEIKHYENDYYKEDETHYRLHLLLIRTMFISLVYLKDKKASKKYLNFLLLDQEWDDLNRGFHLEYYGDKPYDPLKLGLHNDNLNIDFPKTFSRLSKKIYQAVDDSTNEYLMLEIELQTLTSLAVNRHVKNKLESQTRENVLALLSVFKENQIKLNKDIDFLAYIDSSIYILSKKESSISDILRDIYNIKKVKRTGWNFNGERDGKLIERSVVFPESVPEHIFATLIIALLFLPDTIEEDPGYNKTDILKTLLIHDLAEAYTGDVVTFEKTDSKRKIEDERMKMVFSLQIIKGFSNLEHYKGLWESFKTQSTTSAKVAKEIDKIEQLFQLHLYNESGNNSISDYHDWKDELINLVETSIGKNILNTIFKDRHQ